MMTVKDLLESACQSSPDGEHREPALPETRRLWWRIRFCDALAVWNGKAVAIRQTTKTDIKAARGIKGDA